MVKPWPAILATTLIVFGAGAITGAVAVRVYAPKIIHKTHPAPPLPVSSERRNDYLSKLDRELELTPEQHERVEKILAASQQRMKVLWQQIEPQTREEYRRARAEICDLLTPEQQEKMKRMHRGRPKDKPEEKKPGAGQPAQKPEACLRSGAARKC